MTNQNNHSNQKSKDEVAKRLNLTDFKTTIRRDFRDLKEFYLDQERIDRLDPHSLEFMLLKACIGLFKNRDLDLRFLFDNVMIGYKITVFIDEKPRSQPRRSTHFDN